MCRLNCSNAFEILVPQRGLEHTTPALQGRFLFFFFNDFYLFISYLFLAELGLRCCAGFLSCGERGLLSSCSAWGLVAPRRVGSSWTRARTHIPCIDRQILNH